MSDERTHPAAPPDIGEGGEPAPGAGSLLDRIVIVLDETQDLVNIAGAMRAMQNMGLSRLRLVRPAEFDAYRIEGIAHRSAPLIESAEIHDSLDAALADAIFVVGTTARSRTAQRNFVHPRAAAPEILERAREGTVAILFGREDRGLPNEALDRCHRIIVIPTDPEYWSLNLAQACLVVLYELFLATAGGDLPLPEGRRKSRPAKHEDLESMFAALEAGLGRIEFFKARKVEAVLRTIRTVLGRSRMDLRESRLFRAIGFEIGHYLDRRRRDE
jgi:tRNA/rRNA methyltransferase/tRNA (cytidine32/uridine32-2'-O)-methyltransferase